MRVLCGKYGRKVENGDPASETRGKISKLINSLDLV